MVRLTAWVAALVGSAAWLWSGVGWATTPDAQAMAVIRAIAAVLATWLLVATLLAIASRVFRSRWLGVLAPAGVRRLVAGALAGGLLVAPGVAGASTSGTPPPPPGIEVPVLQRVEDATTSTTDTTIDLRAPERPEAAPVRGGREGVHVVEPGDHLWGIAEMEVAARLGRPPSDKEVVPYWRELIEANRQIVGGNPSLIRPGQQIDLPS